MAQHVLDHEPRHRRRAELCRDQLLRWSGFPGAPRPEPEQRIRTERGPHLRPVGLNHGTERRGLFPHARDRVPARHRQDGRRGSSGLCARRMRRLHCRHFRSGGGADDPAQSAAARHSAGRDFQGAAGSSRTARRRSVGGGDPLDPERPDPGRGTGRDQGQCGRSHPRQPGAAHPTSAGRGGGVRPVSGPAQDLGAGRHRGRRELWRDL
ncbi:hypothetical protein D3C72_793760 [compost metagenome]